MVLYQKKKVFLNKKYPGMTEYIAEKSKVKKNCNANYIIKNYQFVL